MPQGDTLQFKGTCKQSEWTNSPEVPLASGHAAQDKQSKVASQTSNLLSTPEKMAGVCPVDP